jgi:hypothetical protein
MSGLKRFSRDGHLLLIVNPFIRVSTVGKSIPQYLVFSCAFFPLGYKVCCVNLQTKNEGQSLSLIVVHLQSTGLHRVQDTFNHSVLTSKNPTVPILNSSSVAVRKQFKIANLPKILIIGKESTGVLAAFLRELSKNCLL